MTMKLLPIIAAAIATTAQAIAAPIEVSVNDRPLHASAIVRHGRVLLPFRSIFSALSAGVDYRPQFHEVVAQRNGVLLRLRIGSQIALINDQPVKLDVSPLVIDERTYVPVRFIAQALGAHVQYDAADRIVFIRDGLPKGTSIAYAPETPHPTFPTSQPYVPPPVYSQYPQAIQTMGFYIPNMQAPYVYFPGDRVQFVLVAPPGGHAYLRLCGTGNYPFYSPFANTQYVVNFTVPRRLAGNTCYATAYYTGALGATNEIPLPNPILFIAPTPAPTPAPTARPTPQPTATPKRTTQPVFRRPMETSPPGRRSRPWQLNRP